MKPFLYCLAGLAGLLPWPALAQLPVTFSVNTAAAARRAISPLIYGTNQPQQAADNYGSVRQGGNRTTGYNWETNASNAGADYLHQSDTYACYVAGLSNADCNVPGKAVASFVQSTQALPGRPAALPTLQMAGYVAADKNGPVSVAETAPSARWKTALPRKPGGNFAYPPDLADNAVYMDEQVHYLTSTFGTAANGGVRGYFLDNEPGLWASTHPRIHPQPVGAAELWQKSRDLAAAVKDVDPAAETYGGVFYGFAEYLNEQSAPDWATEGVGYPWFVDYFLAKMRAAGTAQNRRLLDVLDLHWYPEAQGLDGSGNYVRIVGNNTSPAVSQARLQAPRSLWQAGYRETSWIAQYFSQFLPLIPALQNSINQRYPGTKLSFSEYCYGGCGDISGGLAQADVLGIFGKYGVYNANWWDDCGAGSRSYISPAFRLYTNYDGQGARFGDTGVAAATSDETNTSVYAALQGGSENQLVLVLLNKSSQPVQGTFALSSGARYATARAWGFDQSSPALVARPAPTLNANGAGFAYTLPALSATTIELTAAGPLPVALVEFTAEPQPDGRALLRWRTATEHHSAAFEVERSADGREFQPVLRVPAAGDAATPRSYSARDPQPTAAPLTYYRLRLLDLDGSATFSPVRAVARAASAEALALAAVPTPTPSGTPLRLAVQNAGPAQPAHLLLTDALGRVVLSREVALSTGAGTLELPEAAGWPRGLYLLTVRGKDGAVVKQKVSVE